METEALEREISAPALAVEDPQRFEREELEEARRELAAFRTALDEIHRSAGGDESAEVPYDSTRPDEDAAADVLIQYLVRQGYAEVRTEEPRAGSYVYYIRVDWPKLRALAEEQGYPLPN